MSFEGVPNAFMGDIPYLTRQIECISVYQDASHNTYEWEMEAHLNRPILPANHEVLAVGGEIHYKGIK